MNTGQARPEQSGVKKIERGVKQTWHKQISQLGQQERDDASRWVGHGLGGAPVGRIQVLPPGGQRHLSTVRSAHEGQRHAAQLQNDEDQFGRRPAT